MGNQTMKISLMYIIKQHLKTFKKSDGSFLRVDLIIFIGMPTVLDVVLILILKDIPENFINSLLTSFTILTPLLFGLLPMIFSLIDNKYVSSNSFNIIEEFKANILFTILFSLLLILVLLVWFLTTNWVKVFCNIIIYWLFIFILLHLFLIFNRFNTLINEYIKLMNKNKNT